LKVRTLSEGGRGHEVAKQQAATNMPQWLAQQNLRCFSIILRRRVFRKSMMLGRKGLSRAYIVAEESETRS